MRRPGSRSGTWLVVGMFGFGLTLAAGLYIYLMLHTAPFRSLIVALDERYPDSAPRVDGGKPRVDQPGPRTLRIVMRAPFDPADAIRSETFAREVADFIADAQPLEEFDVIEVHLFQEHPERELSQRTVRLSVEEASGPALRSEDPKAGRP